MTATMAVPENSSIGEQLEALVAGLTSVETRQAPAVVDRVRRLCDTVVLEDIEIMPRVFLGDIAGCLTGLVTWSSTGRLVDLTVPGAGALTVRVSDTDGGQHEYTSCDEPLVAQYVGDCLRRPD